MLGQKMDLTSNGMYEIHIFLSLHEFGFFGIPNIYYVFNIYN